MRSTQTTQAPEFEALYADQFETLSIPNKIKETN